MQSANKNIITKNFWVLGLSCWLLAFSSPVQSFAEEKAEQETLKQETGQLPSFDGKLDLTPQVPEENAENNAETQSLRTDENSANIQKNAEQTEWAKRTEQTEQTGQAAKKAEQPRLPAQKDTILAPGHGNSMIMQEDGSNVMIVHGSNKIPENYTNSTNINNGFYMNITNPDGSGMNMGTYFNSNSSSNAPRKQSKAQMIIDKME